MLGSAYTMIAVDDMDKAKKFYSDTLGLEILEERPDGIAYQAGSGKFFVYESQYAGTNKATYMGWEVDDVAKTAESLKAKGITFEHYDMPDVTHEGDVHSFGEIKAAWFKDPAGNILSIVNG